MTEKQFLLHVKTNYATYVDLVEKRKTVKKSPIKVSESKVNHKAYKFGYSEAEHCEIGEPVKFLVEVKVFNVRDFKFKLMCSSLFEKPFFRYDSDGLCHSNKQLDIPLKEQQVMTPHFNRYNEKGQGIAYKSEALKDEKQLVLLQDIHLCIMHFCQEGEVRFQKEDFPEVLLGQGEFAFDFTEQDPLKGVTF